MQKIARPIREGVVVIEPTTKMDDLKRLAHEFEKQLGVKTFQIHIHRDEGHFKNGEFICNNHAHMLCDWTDEKGKSLKLDKEQMSLMQDITAECLGMERGEKSSRKHLNVVQFKAKAKEEELKEFISAKNKLNEDGIKPIKGIFGIKKDETLKLYENALKGLKIEILDLKKEIEKIKDDKKRLQTDKYNLETEVKNRFEMYYQLEREKNSQIEKAEKAIEVLKKGLAFPELYENDTARETVLQWRNEFIEKDKKNQDARAKWEADKKRAEQEEIERQERLKNRGFRR
jgi:DNA repair exonuclease SbcCD ATPase subunit